MAEITFTIPAEKLQRLVDAIVGLHPISTDAIGNPEFTPNQWAKEYHRRLMVREEFAFERQVAQGTVVEDDTIVT